MTLSTRARRDRKKCPKRAVTAPEPRQDVRAPRHLARGPGPGARFVDGRNAGRVRAEAARSGYPGIELFRKLDAAEQSALDSAIRRIEAFYGKSTAVRYAALSEQRS